MGKGRNRRLIERRNKKIVQRYYYWTEIRRLRFDDAVKKLSEEGFFLSENVIWYIIKQYAKKPETMSLIHQYSEKARINLDFCLDSFQIRSAYLC